MKLITKELEKRFAQVGEQLNSKDPLIIAKLFDPFSTRNWYVTEYDPETQICFGYVTGLAYDGWETFSIPILESIPRPFDLKIKRDRFFKEIRFKELNKEHNNDLEPER